jgi:hypothetical protein
MPRTSGSSGIYCGNGRCGLRSCEVESALTWEKRSGERGFAKFFDLGGAPNGIAESVVDRIVHQTGTRQLVLKITYSAAKPSDFGDQSGVDARIDVTE